LGGDLTLKWRPSSGGKYRALVWTTEYMNGLIAGNPVGGTPDFGERMAGLSSWIQYQFGERWWIQARYDLLGLPAPQGIEPTHKQSVLLGFFPSEFSGFRLQYDHLTQNHSPTDHSALLQWIISIGAHPAHAY
jgi:hypothetical protein